MVRGQAFTLEAIVASMLLLTALVAGLQMSAVSPFTASTSDRYVESQNRATVQGALQTAAERGSVRTAVLSWNDSSDGFDGTSNGYFTHSPPNVFGRVLDRTLVSRGLVYNVDLLFENEDDEQRQRRLVYRGEPSETAVTASWPVTLYDTDERYGIGDEPTGDRIDGTNFYAPDSAPDSVVYNVVVVEVVVWRR